MKLHFAGTMTVQRSLLALTAVLLPPACNAGDLENTNHATIERFIDQDTVLVGWVDLSQLDLDSLKKLAADVDLGHLPTIPRQVRKIRATLVELGVTRVYWFSSLADLFEGPGAFLIPASRSRADSVALLLRSATSAGQSVIVDENVVLAGEDSIIADLQGSSGMPMQHLVAALAQSNSPNGIVVGASARSLRTASTLLKIHATKNGDMPTENLDDVVTRGDSPNHTKTAEFRDDAADLSKRQSAQDREFTGTLSRMLPDFSSAALHGQLPPSTAIFQVEMASKEAASNLATFLNAESAERLKGGALPVQLSASGSTVTMSKSSLDASIRTLRALVQLLQPARYRAGLQMAKTNHKQIALGLHNFHDRHARFPPQRLVDEQGTPLHSWRVLILPYLGEEQLYKQFRLDEPWDSDHNMKLAGQIPAFLRSPDDSAEMTAAGKTRFVAPLTDDSMLGHRGDSARIRDIIDGTSNTLMAVQTTPENAVIWTKPDDLVLTSDRPVFEQIAGDADGFTACTCDGAAHYIDRNFTEETLRTMLSMAGGEILEWP